MSTSNAAPAATIIGIRRRSCRVFFWASIANLPSMVATVKTFTETMKFQEWTHRFARQLQIKDYKDITESIRSVYLEFLGLAD